MYGSPEAGLRTIALLGIVGLLLATAIAPAGTASAATQQAAPEPDNTVTRIDVDANGTAQWTIRIRTRLDTDEHVDEYEAFRARFRNDTAQYLDPFRNRIRGVVANAANATGREMRATNVTATTSVQEVPRRWGVVTYQFTWTNFADRPTDAVAVGDVFRGGFFIAANDTLTVDAPPGYAVDRVDPAPDGRDEGSVTWTGREDFANEHPRVVFTPTGGNTETQSEDNSAATPTSIGGDGPPITLIGIVSLGTVGAAAYAIRRRRRRSDVSVQSTATDRGEPPDATANQSPDSSEQPDDPTAAPVLTDEERVLALLEENGGRMRQAAIDEAFDWSTSKTSRLVGTMVEEGAVEKRRLGRENLIDLVDDE
ncbi:helix-turn-helix transcriptional regulator [Natrinema sp. 74]|uniref:helix-turn-helix transcriptional regulator n=1 Tax=Natrinema sp. 74 TaxID=3384159 RepID=UPI0038D49EAF